MSTNINYHGRKLRCVGELRVTKKVHRWLMILLLSGMVMMLALFGIAESGTGNTSIFGMVATGIMAILLIAGVEIRRIEFGKLKIVFEQDDNE